MVTVFIIFIILYSPTMHFDLRHKWAIQCQLYDDNARGNPRICNNIITMIACTDHSINLCTKWLRAIKFLRHGSNFSSIDFLSATSDLASINFSTLQ